MLRRLLILSLLTTHCLCAHAAEQRHLDSLQAVLDTTQDVNSKLWCLYSLSYENGLINPRKGIDLAWQCMALAISQNNLVYQMRAYNALGNAYETLADFDSASYFHTKSYQIAIRLKSRSYMIPTLVNVANCNKQQGNYRVALEKYLMACRMMESEPVYNYRVHCSIADLYLKLGDYNKAVEHSRLGIYKVKQRYEEAAVLNLYVTLSKTLLYSGKVDSAYAVIKNTVDKLKKYTDAAGLCLGLNTLGEVYLAKKMYSHALQAFSEELPIEATLQNKNGICLTQVNIAYCQALLHKNKNNTELLLKYIEECIKTNAPGSEILLDIYKKLSDIYGLTGNSNKAYQYAKRYWALNDSLLSRDKFRQIMELQAQFESEKVDQLLRQQKARLQLQASDIQKRKGVFT